MPVLQTLAWVFLGLLVLYMSVRVAAAAWFKSKRQFGSPPHQSKG